ncbi:hypothetical protein ACFW1A_17050 [Kitasatospora sp. NPDC058965]|uniref:hypothetical protein n=1 Tax=Kitasatospora sp. NPDC058965 TaxID=3346682 RepID=UPI0036CBB00E
MTKHDWFDRGFPECRCPADCGGRPEATARLLPAYPTPRPAEATPPAVPYQPTANGELVFDTLNGRAGVFMDRRRSLVYLRPEGGGPEWDVHAMWLLKVAP